MYNFWNTFDIFDFGNSFGCEIFCIECNKLLFDETFIENRIQGLPLE